MVRNDLEGKTGLILGGSSGLGLATAIKLAAHGMRLIIVYRASRIMQDTIQTSFSKLKSPNLHLMLNVDATNSTKIPDIILQIQEFLGSDKLHLLLHSISKGNLKPMTGEQPLTTNDLEQTIASMGISLYTWFHALQQAQLLNNQSRILAFTSEGGSKPMPGYAAVSAAKATLEALIRNIALEYAHTGVTANCIQAGVTDTASLRFIPQVETLLARSLERNPTNRLTTPQDVANVVYLMNTPEAAFINGTIIKVDGGEHLN